MKEKLIELTQKSKNIEEKIRLLVETIPSKIVFSTSFGMEDQVISHAIFSQKIEEIEVFTLDTGRLFSETYSVWDKTLLQYSTKISAYYPESEAVEKWVTHNGINAFYASPEFRKECCFIRKVAPLHRALKGATVWITGVRAEHSDNRAALQEVEWDEKYQVYKFNPLLDWTTQDVKEYLVQKGVPYNVLHDKGFVSIGCAPCTRAIQEGEDFRAGRWWWENQTKKECGLHN